MSKTSTGLLISAVLAGNIITIALIIAGREKASSGADDRSGGAAIRGLRETVEALRGDVSRLSVDVASGARASTAPAAAERQEGASESIEQGLGKRFDEVLQRLDGLEKTLAAMKDVNAELALAELREKRQEQFRAEDGYAVADELLAQKQFAVGANGILTFLEAHPEHPDARDLMKKARDAFAKAGYGEKAIWLQGEMMERFPENRGADLYSLAMLEKKARKIDEALAHMDESLELAKTEQDRMNRLFYRAYLIHQRNGDVAGLEAYREVERLSRAADITTPANEAQRRADMIAERLGSQ